MTPADVARVLAKASAFDQRTIGAADVAAWHEVLADVNFADALAAVGQHYRESTDRLMPAHVRRLADGMERDRRRAEQALREQAEGLVRRFGVLERQPADAIRSETEDRSDELRELLAQLAAKLGPSDPTILRRKEWVEVERQRERADRAEPNPNYTGPPPPDGHPIPGENGDTDAA